LSSGGTYTSYQWTTGLTPPTIIAGATNGTYTYTVSGTYGVLVDSGGCIGFDTIVVSTTGIANVNGTETQLWAGTWAGSLVLHSSALLSENLTVDIFDATGRNVKKAIWERDTQVLQVADLAGPPGVYIIRVSGQNTREVLRWLKQ